MTIFKLSSCSAWPLSLFFIVLGIFFVVGKKDIARRMADMTGYTTREKVFTTLASIAPYPFMVATVWIPFTDIRPLLYLGVLLYIIGMVLFMLSIVIIIKTPQNEPFVSGPYRFSRNPMYVAATIIFTSICFATANIVLACYLVIAVILQHFMILAEERICVAKFGPRFEDYLNRVPRYLFV